ncbi:ATP-binding cassette domain-containing protein [Rothia halotolerans]|uniref:ATP-binding cassette domain-containing protein n=1 Tax=Rothia halotolerans TaxID=405770 RepID=UPI00101CC18C|nr:ATP-binding cassette domain-containing protein [Rothia halotolerans]
MIEAHDLSIRIGRRLVVESASLACLAGELTALTGPSGCGKTTLLHGLGLLLRPVDGRVAVDGEDATRWSERRRRAFWRERAAFIQQDYGVIDDASLAFNVALRTDLFGRPARGPLPAVGEALRRVDLRRPESETAAHLSGGEKQRLAAARALYREADVVFADEPTASLDQGNRDRVTELLEELAEEGTAVIIATHDERLVRRCSRVHEMARPM